MTYAICRNCLAHPEPDDAACFECGSPRLLRHPEAERLHIAHLDCDAFYASIEKRDDPGLADKPLLVGHPGGRGVVTTACYIARRFGPRSAMPMFKALQLCPDAVVVRPDMAKYKAVSAAIRELMHDCTDVVEPVSLDEAYLDLSPANRKAPAPAVELLVALARRIEGEIGITVSIGLSYNKFLAKLASDLEKPRGFSILGRAEARGFLAALPVGRIHGVGAATERRMARLGLTTIAELQALPEAELVARFGKFGRRLAGFVNGEDDRPVTPSRPAKSISVETTFASDLRAPARLEAELAPLANRVAERLARSGLAGRTIVLKLKTADFRILTRNRQLARPTQRSEVILAAAGELLAREADGRAFRLLGVGLTDLEDAAAADPPDLFSAIGPVDLS
ncbi:MAG: DNA polymerase IV [Rhizobiales bacterium]|nr:DNA polymerase IV [Hyphomicrobiales bacterium]